MALHIRRTKASLPTNTHLNKKVSLEYVDISDIAPYEFNPRDNQAAIGSVANSIKSFGFLIPIVIDESNVIAAGHTRVEAAKTLGMTEVPAIRATHLTEEQINAFRVIDNKVAELAKWDFDMLSSEIEKLQSSGLTLTDFGWSREELDCLSQVVQEDCLVGDAVDAAARDRIRRAERRAPATARFVLGELTFFIPASVYRTWVESLRAVHDFDENAIVVDLKHRLQIPDY